MSHHLFVSYAHADNAVPAGATKGWVTTLVDELEKVLRRKLGGAPQIWMDHQLAANQNVTAELLARLRSSRTLLLMMSPGYQRSEWCQRELANYAAEVSARGWNGSIFAIEIEPVDRSTWHPTLQSLTPVRFWERSFEDRAPRLMGFPVPKPDEDSPYWRNVNELAHLIARQLNVDETVDASSRPVVFLAEPTEDLLDERDMIAMALRQRDVVIVPVADYPRAVEDTYIAAVGADMQKAALFVQLLGQHEGRRPSGGQVSFVALQARAALSAARNRPFRVMQWRRRDVKLDEIASESYRSLLLGQHVFAGGIEEFRQGVLRALGSLDEPPGRDVTSLATSNASGAVEPAPPRSAAFARHNLCVFVHTDMVDHEAAEIVGDQLQSLGVSSLLSPEPTRGQSFLEGLQAQEDALRMCDGVMLVYGRSPAVTVSTSFQYARRVFGFNRQDVWGAVLDLPPADKPKLPIKSPNLMTIDCRSGIEAHKLRPFIAALRSRRGSPLHA